MDAAETLQWHLFGEKSWSNFGLKRTHHKFRVGIYRESGALQNSVISCWKNSTFNLRLEVPNLCVVHARSRIQQYTQGGRKHDSKNSSVKYYIYNITRNILLTRY